MTALHRALWSWTILALGCTATGPAPDHVGHHDWCDGAGRLTLCADGSFVLVQQGADGTPGEELRGDWSGPTWGGTFALAVRETRWLAEPATGADPTYPAGTEILVLLADGSATYLGRDGVIDLNQGF